MLDLIVLHGEFIIIHYSQLEATFGTKFIEIGEKKFCARACPLLH